MKFWNSRWRRRKTRKKFPQREIGTLNDFWLKYFLNSQRVTESRSELTTLHSNCETPSSHSRLLGWKKRSWQSKHRAFVTLCFVWKLKVNSNFSRTLSTKDSHFFLGAVFNSILSSSRVWQKKTAHNIPNHWRLKKFSPLTWPFDIVSNDCNDDDYFLCLDYPTKDWGDNKSGQQKLPIQVFQLALLLLVSLFYSFFVCFSFCVCLERSQVTPTAIWRVVVLHHIAITHDTILGNLRLFPFLLSSNFSGW